jgi:hypothetical protein
MTTKTKSRSPALRPAAEAPPDPGLTPPWTTEERLQRIQALGQRVEGYVRFICAVGELSGTSAEAKEKAVAVFYERLAILEHQLGRIQEELQLG